jgi:hypothetical protein
MSPEKVSNLMVGSLIVGAMDVWEGSVVVARRIMDIEAIV